VLALVDVDDDVRLLLDVLLLLVVLLAHVLISSCWVG
jgi:hypothetical protein